MQYENWLLGITLACLMINACVVTTIFVLSSSHPFSTKTRLSLAAIFCFVASFSSAQGLLTWLAVMPSVASINGNYIERLRRIIFWIGLSIISFLVYSIGYQQPSYHPDIFLFLKQPLVAVNYFLTLLGASLIRTPMIAAIAGFILLFAFLLFTVYCIKNIKVVNYTAPWLSLGSFAILWINPILWLDGVNQIIAV